MGPTRLVVEAVRASGLGVNARAGQDTGGEVGTEADADVGCGGSVVVVDRESSVGLVEEGGRAVSVGVEALLRLLRLRVERLREVENRLEARFVPLGGGVQVRLIFSNGMELSESDEDE